MKVTPIKGSTLTLSANAYSLLCRDMCWSVAAILVLELAILTHYLWTSQFQLYITSGKRNCIDLPKTPKVCFQCIKLSKSYYSTICSHNWHRVFTEKLNKLDRIWDTQQFCNTYIRQLFDNCKNVYIVKAIIQASM